MPRSKAPADISAFLARQEEAEVQPLTPEARARITEESFQVIDNAYLIPLERIKPWDRQPRKNAASTPIDDLAASIRDTGLLEPLVVRRDLERPGTYTIVAGHRRYLALTRLHADDEPAISARFATAPALVRELTDGDAYADALAENLSRTDLTRRETIDAYMALQTEYGWSGSEIARRTGRSVTDVNEQLRIAREPALYTLVVEETISPSLAGKLFDLSDDERAMAVRRLEGGERLTNAQLDDLIRASKAARRQVRPVRQGGSVPDAPPGHDPAQGAPPLTVSVDHTTIDTTAETAVDTTADTATHSGVTEADAPAPMTVPPHTAGDALTISVGAGTMDQARRVGEDAASPHDTRRVFVEPHTRRAPQSSAETAAAQAALHGEIERAAATIITALHASDRLDSATMGVLRTLMAEIAPRI